MTAHFRPAADTGTTVTITVDGRALQAPRGQSLLAALLSNGAGVEFHCAIGQCQRCLVRVNGRVETACLYLPKDGDIIHTEGTLK